MSRLERLVLNEEGRFVGAERRDARTYNRRVEVEPVGEVMLVSFPKKELRWVEEDIDGWEAVVQNFMPEKFYSKDRRGEGWGFEVGNLVIRGVFKKVVYVPVKFYFIKGFYYENGHFESFAQ